MNILPIITATTALNVLNTTRNIQSTTLHNKNNNINIKKEKTKSKEQFDNDQSVDCRTLSI